MKNKKGMTLIEILMVMFIIGLISSIVISNYNSQKEQSKIATTKANLETLRLAMRMYRSNEDTQPSTDLASLWDGSSPSGHVYLSSIPYEAFNWSNAVSTAPTYTGGWFLDTTVNWNYAIYPNLVGQDANQTSFGDY